MSSISRLFLGVMAAVIVGVLVYTSQISDAPQSKPTSDEESSPTLTILWAKWQPADYLQQLSQDFTAETGIQVRVVQESWGDWQEIFFNEMKYKGQAYDMVIGDSQWLGRGARGGHYIELTNWIKDHGVDETMIAAAMKGYSEFPKQSGHYWAVPVEGDAMGFSYRKDLFEDPQEKKEFIEKYGYPLDVPKTWFQLRDIAEFFYRPEQDFYGVLTWQEPHYDGITMGVDALIWAWGADLGDARNYKVKGILNSPEGIAALEFYKELNRFNNSAWVNNYLDSDSSSNQPMMDGKVAMSMGYFAINPELLDPEKNPYADKMGFFANPMGPKARVTSLGGQGISIVSYSHKKSLALKYLKWFVRDDTQEKWASLGGLTCNKRVLASSAFLEASPINQPYKESIEMVRDFWAVPEYPQLLSISQRHWHDYVQGHQPSAKVAMDEVAEAWESTFEAAGYYKE